MSKNYNQNNLTNQSISNIKLNTLWQAQKRKCTKQDARKNISTHESIRLFDSYI